MTSEPPVVSTNELSMRFGDHLALDNLDLSIGSGVTGLVGANGAGKTTLFNLWLGLLTPTAGAVSVAGLNPVSDGAVVRSRIGFSPERNLLPADMAANEFVRHLAEVKGLPRSEARGRASDALWLVGLGEERFRPLGTMSTGQRQRVKLAQALASDPELILLDEPTDGLDPIQRDEMLHLVADIHRDVGLDIVISSHVLEEVERVCTNVVILDGGRLLAAGAVSDLVSQSLGGVVVEIIDTASVPDATAAVTKWLVEAGFSVEQDGAQLIVSDGSQPTTDGEADVADEPEGPALDAVRDAVTAVGARVQSIGTRRMTLEDVFLQAENSHQGNR